jgi:hypothetical protein
MLKFCLGLVVAAGLLVSTGCSHCGKDKCATTSGFGCCPPPCCDGAGPTATQAYSGPYTPGGCCNGR